MIILALDSCGSSCAVCLWQNGHILAQEHESMERGQDTRLMPMIVSVIKSAGHHFSDLDMIAVTRGPGSFTGMRVGLATARGIGLASSKPVVGIDRFALYHALHSESSKNILVVINSKRAELFCKFYPASALAHEATLMTEQQIQTFIKENPDTIIVGDCATPNDNIIFACAELAGKIDIFNSHFLPLPLYLRAPDVSFAKSR